MGSVGEAVFFAVLGLAGFLAIVVLLVSARMRTWPAQQYFPEALYPSTKGTILDKQITQLSDAVGRDGHRVEIFVEYIVQGQVYRQWAPYSSVSSNRSDQTVSFDALKVGEELFCWFDPDEPNRVIAREPSRWGMYLILFVLASFALIGVGGVIYTVLQLGTSAERRAALARNAANLDLIREASLSPFDFPTVPRDTDLTNSPGVTLAYRLPVATSPAWKVFVAAIFCVVWNAIATLFVIVVIRGLIHGHPDLLLALVSIPFVAVGCWSVYYTLLQLWVTAGVGPTHLEISDHPIYPERQYHLFLSQTGRMSIQSLEMFLICEEEATFRQGTDVRTECRLVFRDRILQTCDVEIKPGSPMERKCGLQLPADVMHSFRSINNLVRWKLVVEGMVKGRPAFQRSFPIVVYPRIGGDVQ